MIAWIALTTLLLLWNLLYCALKIRADFRGPKPANGVWGLFALAGVLSALAMLLAGSAVALSGI